jgi:hypothetical protein
MTSAMVAYRQHRALTTTCAPRLGTYEASVLPTTTRRQLPPYDDHTPLPR